MARLLDLPHELLVHIMSSENLELEDKCVAAQPCLSKWDAPPNVVTPAPALQPRS